MGFFEDLMQSDLLQGAVRAVGDMGNQPNNPINNIINNLGGGSPELQGKKAGIEALTAERSRIAAMVRQNPTEANLAQLRNIEARIAQETADYKRMGGGDIDLGGLLQFGARLVQPFLQRQPQRQQQPQPVPQPQPQPQPQPLPALRLPPAVPAFQRQQQSPAQPPASPVRQRRLVLTLSRGLENSSSQTIRAVIDFLSGLQELQDPALLDAAIDELTSLKRSAEREERAKLKPGSAGSILQPTAPVVGTPRTTGAFSFNTGVTAAQGCGGFNGVPYLQVY